MSVSTKTERGVTALRRAKASSQLDHMMQHQLVGHSKMTRGSLHIDDLETVIRIWLGTVDEFVAVKASEITRVQQFYPVGSFALIESKGLASRTRG